MFAASLLILADVVRRVAEHRRDSVAGQHEGIRNRTPW